MTSINFAIFAKLFLLTIVNSECAYISYPSGTCCKGSASAKPKQVSATHCTSITANPATCNSPGTRPSPTRLISNSCLQTSVAASASPEKCLQSQAAVAYFLPSPPMQPKVTVLPAPACPPKAILMKPQTPTPPESIPVVSPPTPPCLPKSPAVCSASSYPTTISPCYNSLPPINVNISPPSCLTKSLPVCSAPSYPTPMCPCCNSLPPPIDVKIPPPPCPSPIIPGIIDQIPPLISRCKPSCPGCCSPPKTCSKFEKLPISPPPLTDIVLDVDFLVDGILSALGV